MQLTLDPVRYTCALGHRYHRPLPLVLHAHHVVPMSWTKALRVPPSRTVPLCPTGHENIHVLLRDWITGRRTDWRGVDERVRALVSEALDFYRANAPAQDGLAELAP